MPRCSSCRTVVSVDTQFCPQCGAAIASSADVPTKVMPTVPTSPASPKNPATPWAAPAGQWSPPEPRASGSQRQSAQARVILLAIGAGLLGLIAGVAVGAGGRVSRSELSSVRADLSSTQARMRVAESSQQAAQDRAANAETKARADAQASMTNQSAALDAR